MQQMTALLWWHLNVLTKKRYDALQDQYGSLDAALSDLSVDLLRSIGCKEETALKTMNRLEETDAHAIQASLTNRRIILISWEDDVYPRALRTITDPPVFLTAIGDLSILDQPCIALVGTRDMSPYGERVTETFASAFVQSGMVTVSGLAYGIDAAVARETLTAGGRTVAVLGHGLGMIYPKANRTLADDVVKAGGLLLSEFPLDAMPDKYTFPARNRIIAGLSSATVVLEATEGSGSLITAELAEDYGRHVFAVPGQIFDPHYAGCHQIIANDRARLARGPEDVLLSLGIRPADLSRSKEIAFDSPEEEAVYGALTTMPQTLDDMASRAKLDAAVLNATLTMLELKGAVRSAGEGTWVRT